MVLEQGQDLHGDAIPGQLNVYCIRPANWLDRLQAWWAARRPKGMVHQHRTVTSIGVKLTADHYVALTGDTVAKLARLDFIVPATEPLDETLHG